MCHRHFFIIVIIFKLIVMTVEILFILHVANGILIIIHNFERYTYMYSNTITSTSTLPHIHVIIFSIHKIFIHTSIRIVKVN